LERECEEDTPEMNRDEIGNLLLGASTGRKELGMELARPFKLRHMALRREKRLLTKYDTVNAARRNLLSLI